MASREGEVRSCTAVLSVEHVSLVCENEFGACRRSLQDNTVLCLPRRGVLSRENRYGRCVERHASLCWQENMEAEDARILATAHFLAEPLPAAGLPAAMPPPLEVQATAVHDNLPADAVVVPNVPEAGSSSTHAALIPVDGAGTALVAADDADASRKRRRGGDGSGDSHQENQERMYDLLRAFAARTGHANAPRGHIEAGEKLGIWLMHQRTRHRLRTMSEAEAKAKKIQRSAMTDEELARLDALGVTWDIQRPNQKDPMLDALRVFFARERHGNAPRGAVENGQKLGIWLAKQRTRYKLRSMTEEEKKAKKIQRSTMTDEEVASLEALGVTWQNRNSEAVAASVANAPPGSGAAAGYIHIEQAYLMGDDDDGGLAAAAALRDAHLALE
jgi:hypothetical protein